MTIHIDKTRRRLNCYATIVAAQGSWKWQKRLRVMRYTAVRLRNGELAWGRPEFRRNTSGGNLRGDPYPGEQSPYMHRLTTEQCLAVYAYDLETPDNYNEETANR